ncbi:tripartite tricarboxylate transporter substrate binding protein [Bacillaceae bacterium]
MKTGYRVFVPLLFIVLLMFASVGCGSQSTGLAQPPANNPSNNQPSGSDGKQEEGTEPDFPTKNIRFIVPVSAGGGFDTIARMFVPYWEKHLGKNAKIIVENRPGGEWNIGLSILYKAEPDGYTVGLLNLPGNVISQIMGTANYDLTKFSWIGRISDEIYVGAASRQSGIKSIQDMIEKKNIKAGVVGLASTAGLGTVIAAERFGVNVTPVPHDGSNEAVLSALRGSVDYVQFPFGTLKGSIEAGELTPIIIYAEERLPDFPDIPTAKELGYEDLLSVVSLHRMVAAPSGVPEDVLQVLRDTFAQAVADPEFKQKMIEYQGSFNPADAKRTEMIAEMSLKEMQKYKSLIEKYNK